MKEAREQSNSTKLRSSREGFEFDPSSDHWRLSRDVQFELTTARKLLSENLFQGFIGALSDTATTHSAMHTINMFYGFCHLVRTIGLDAKTQVLTSVEFVNFKSTLDKRTEWNLGRLVGFIKKWSEAGHPGLAVEVVSLLEGWRLAGNPKGEAVRLRCPLTGPLTPMEFELFQARLLDGLEDRLISFEDYALTALFAATGRRRSQLADGKWGDFKDSMNADVPALLSVARRKGEGAEWRTQFKVAALSPELALTFRTLRAETYKRAKELIPELTEVQLESLPIFIRWSQLATFSRSSNSVLNAVTSGGVLHCQSQMLGSRLTNAVAKLAVGSDRLASSIRVNATRLRRTLATRAAREGLSVLIIAELLDHTDTQNAGVYTENVPENVDPLNEAVGNQIAPLMKAFRGELIESEIFAARGTDKSSRIRTEAGTKAGNCSRCGTCVARAPIACYTCRAFQPWLDGDHRAVLNQLQEERVSCDDPIIAEACDLSIFAVREVIKLCELRKLPAEPLEKESV